MNAALAPLKTISLDERLIRSKDGRDECEKVSCREYYLEAGLSGDSAEQRNSVGVIV